MQSAPSHSVTYLLRAWVAGVAPDGSVQVRYLVERVGDASQRQGFDSFAALVAYLHSELGGERESELALPPDSC